jgi:hypothetical protein
MKWQGFEGNDCVLVWYYGLLLALEEYRARTPETVADASGEIQTGHLASASQQHYGLN